MFKSFKYQKVHKLGMYGLILVFKEAQIISSNPFHCFKTRKETEAQKN